jgi:hypothetical protein
MMIIIEVDDANETELRLAGTFVQTVERDGFVGFEDPTDHYDLKGFNVVSISSVMGP